MKKLASIFTIIMFMPFVANAEIASKAYVDKLIYGTTAPEFGEGGMFDEIANGGIPGALQNVIMAEDLDGYVPLDDFNDVVDNQIPEMISEGLDQAVSNEQDVNNAILVTDNDGNVKLATGGYITNAKISSNAEIELGKLAFPTPPAECNTTGCMLMFYNGKYVWEPVERNNNESISTAGYVSATATATQTTTEDVKTPQQTIEEEDSGKK